MPRGSRFSSVLTWFREADPDEVRAIMPLVIEAVGRRKIVMETVASQPRVRRHRRTRAEMEASRLNGADHAAAATVTT